VTSEVGDLQNVDLARWVFGDLGLLFFFCLVH
jgi:hypothetical protein